MSAQAAPVEAAVSFQINRSDVGPLFVDRLQLSWNALCPLAEDLERYGKGSARGSDSLDAVANHPVASRVGAIVTSPDLRIVHRSGGGTQPMEPLYACRGEAFGRETLVLVAPSFEESLLVRLFPDLEGYLGWWLDTFASSVQESVPNFMPPPLALESLLYLLHCIDVFRRVAYEGLLNYTPNADPSLKPADFVSTMERSVRSKDLRWLLPAFLQLTPGLSRYSFEPRAEHMDPLIQNSFVTVGRDARGQEVFQFGEGGKVMGVEFYRTWLRAVGFAPEVLTAQGPRMLPAVFLAPTAVSNHLIRLEEEGPGKARANHQAMTLSELEAKLREMLRTVLSTPLVQLAATEEAAVPSAAEAPRAEETRPAPSGASPVCGSCGGSLKAGAKFCPACGKAVEAMQPPSPAAVGTCPKCGARNAPGTKFCRECGNALSG